MALLIVMYRTVTMWVGHWKSFTLFAARLLICVTSMNPWMKWQWRIHLKVTTCTHVHSVGRKCVQKRGWWSCRNFIYLPGCMLFLSHSSVVVSFSLSLQNYSYQLFTWFSLYFALPAIFNFYFLFKNRGSTVFTNEIRGKIKMRFIGFQENCHVKIGIVWNSCIHCILICNYHISVLQCIQLWLLTSQTRYWERMEGERDKTVWKEFSCEITSLSRTSL